MQRRSFIGQTTLATTGLLLPWSNSISGSDRVVTFGLMADPHKDLLHDVDERLETFLKATEDVSSDFILQLGDFCFPKTENQSFLNLWNGYIGPKYHVLGNHDMDISSKQETMDFWQMPSNYYSFEHQGYHFVVLDANFLNYDGKYQDYHTANFYVDSSLRTWINPDQIEWLRNDLRETTLPTIIFSHQSLVNDLWGIKNRSVIQRIFEEENRKAGFQKVLACFNGHNHIDSFRKLNDIYYIDINSMSYQWLGEKYQTKVRYPTEIYEHYPMMINMAPYQKSLFAFVELTEKRIKISGIESGYIGPSPAELGLTEDVYGFPFTSNLSSRHLTF